MQQAEELISEDNLGDQARPRPGPGTPLEEAVEYYMDDPVAWGNDLLGAKYWEWQEEAMLALAHKRFVAIRSGHNVGKTFLLSNIITWFLTCHPMSKVLCTAPTKEQLFDNLWAECAARIRESKSLASILDHRKDTIVVKGFEKEWFALARTAEVRKQGKTGLSMAEGLQGRHAQEGILLVLDEASGIDEVIMNTVDGVLAAPNSYVIMTGNPTRSSGRFYDVFHSRGTSWHKIHVDCEQISKAHPEQVDPHWIEMMQETYGSREHPLYLIRVRGEFPPAQHNSVFSLDRIEAAKSLKLEPTRYDPYELGVDVARYGDGETVFVVKQGSKIVELKGYEQRSTMETVGRVIQYINHLKPIAVKIDSSGVGGGVVDRLRELNYDEIIAVDNGSAPTDTKNFINVRAESYWHLKTLLETKAIQIPDDPVLHAQMTAVTYEVNSRGKIKIESKEDLRRRGVKSPDRLDALVLACMSANMPRKRARFGTFNFMGR
jgi:hypothetical protein